MDDTTVEQHAYKQLEKIAEQMEYAEPGSKEMKELNRDYKITMEQAGITTNGKLENGEYELSSDKIKKSKDDCYKKILEALDSFESWEAKIKLMHISSMGHIEFSYNENHRGVPMEIQFMIVDDFYKAYSGAVATKNRVNLFSAKQLEAYHSLEYGLLKFTLGFVRGAQRKEFVSKYAIPFNEKIKSRSTSV